MQLITKAQADFIKTFGRNKKKAVYYILRWGWDFLLTDGNENEYEKASYAPFKLDDKLMMIDAIINGYEVKKNEKWVLATDIYVKGERTTIYYQGEIFVPSDSIKEACKFDSKEEAYETKELMELNEEYFPQPIND